MKNILMNLHYDNYTVAQSIKFIESSYGQAPSQKLINIVKKELLEQSNRVWN